MAWTTQETKTIDGDTVLRQIGSGDDVGHRVVVNGTPGTAAPLGRVAINGDYRAVQPEFNLQATYLPTLFKAQESTASSFPAGPATVTITAANIEFDRAFAIATGTGKIHAWDIYNNAGVGGNDDFIDAGGGPSDAVLAGRFETRIDAVALDNVSVERVDNVLTISCTDGVVVFSGDDGAVVS